MLYVRVSHGKFLKGGGFLLRKSLIRITRGVVLFRNRQLLLWIVCIWKIQISKQMHNTFSSASMFWQCGRQFVVRIWEFSLRLKIWRSDGSLILRLDLARKFSVTDCYSLTSSRVAPLRMEIWGASWYLIFSKALHFWGMWDLFGACGTHLVHWGPVHLVQQVSGVKVSV